LFSSLVNSTANCGLLSNITFSGNLCNFYMLSLNNLANLSANVPSVVATKWTILNNLLHTTKIASFLTTNSNFMIKSTIRCVHGFYSTSWAINFPASVSVWFFSFSDTYYIYLYIFLHLLLLPATSNFL